MRHWIVEPSQNGCVWKKRSDPNRFNFVIMRKDGMWLAACASVYDGDAKIIKFESQRADDLGIDLCLAYMLGVVQQGDAPEFDVVEAKNVLREHVGDD